jgi:hypothetical protein
MPTVSMRRRLRTSVRELTGQLSALAVALWVVAIANTITPTPYLRSGQVRGTDFVQFYTLARLSASGNLTRFDDFDTIRRIQLEAVPESSHVWFPPVYGPQVPLALTPLAWFSYNGALLLWVVLSATAYALLCRYLIRRSEILSAHSRVTLLGALTFPAFWQLVQHGQLTVLAVAITVTAWSLMRRGRPVLAGAVLGLLMYKPPLLAPVLVLLFIAGEWRMWVPAVATGAAEVLVTGFWIGFDGLRRYVFLMLHLPTMSTLLFTKPEQAHGLKAFWAILIPQPTFALILYAVSAVAVLIVATLVWRRQSDATPRMTVLLLTVSLVAPYLFVYDLTILAPVWIWLADWFLRREIPPVVGRCLYVGYLAPLAAPIVPFIHIQPSTPCLVFLLYAMWRYRDAPVLKAARTPTSAG